MQLPNRSQLFLGTAAALFVGGRSIRMVRVRRPYQGHGVLMASVSSTGKASAESQEFQMRCKICGEYHDPNCTSQGVSQCQGVPWFGLSFFSHDVKLVLGLILFAASAAIHPIVRAEVAKNTASYILLAIGIVTLYHTSKEEMRKGFEELRGDSKELKEELKGEMKELKEELKGEMKELKSEMKELKEELKGEMKELKEELKGVMKQVEKNIGEKLDILLEDKYFRDGVEHGKSKRK